MRCIARRATRCRTGRIRGGVRCAQAWRATQEQGDETTNDQQDQGDHQGIDPVSSPPTHRIHGITLPFIDVRVRLAVTLGFDLTSGINVELKSHGEKWILEVIQARVSTQSKVEGDQIGRPQKSQLV